jgi:saccharopine dehydrogenase (NADP+, L-glutamate forming)
MDQYKFDPNWRVKYFVRGSLRLNGWAEAWVDVFREIETLKGTEGDQRMKEMSQEFWSKHAYGANDPDRVVLCVSLQAERGDAVVWHKTYVMDAWGDEDGTAMARLVSVPVSLAVQAVLDGQISAGVSAAPHDPDLVIAWLKRVDSLAQHLTIVDHS